MAFTRVVLGDGKPALQVVAGGQTYNLRVRLLSKEMVEVPGGYDIALHAEAYRVDDSGAPVMVSMPDGSQVEDKAPSRKKTISGAALAEGSLTLADQQQDLMLECVQGYVAWKRAQIALNAASDELVQ
jgi:uncharacterized protein GlcG (DUF336 family)